MPKSFVDTNVLVYAMDAHDRARRKRCRELLADLRRDGTGAISTQVLQEFYVVATKKLSRDPIRVKPLLHWFEKHFEIVTVSAPLIREAVDCSVVSRISFWDALIVVAAESARTPVLYTEDLNAGQVIRGVKIVNPVAP